MKYLLGLMLIVFPVGGAFTFLTGVRGLWTTWWRRPFLLSAEGTIVATQQHRAIRSTHRHASSPHTAYNPVLRFTTESGEVREFCSPAGQLGNSSPYTIGMAVPVLYDPDDILPPTIDSWSAVWGGHMLFVIVGLIFLAGAGLVYFAFGHRIFE